MDNIRYKLLTQEMTSYNNCRWTLNEWKVTDGSGLLCAPGWLHCYTDPLLAIIFNPLHAAIDNPLLFKCEVKGKNLTDHGLKEGWTEMRITEKLEIPNIFKVQIIAFGILCSLEMYKEEKYTLWANDWLSGKDRSAIAASTAANAVSTAANAAYAAANVAANVANNAIYAAACASNAAANYKPLDLISIVKEAMKVK